MGDFDFEASSVAAESGSKEFERAFLAAPRERDVAVAEGRRGS
jgi:hypothetical protein